MSWEATLAAFAERLDQLEAAISTGAFGELPAFEPAADLGVLPAPLRGKARDLLTRSVAIEAKLQRAVGDAATELVAIRRARASSDQPPPRLIDRTA